MSLHARKQKLKRLIPDQPSALLYVDHIEQRGDDLFALACREDLEGIVAITPPVLRKNSSRVMRRLFQASIHDEDHPERPLIGCGNLLAADVCGP